VTLRRIGVYAQGWRSSPHATAATATIAKGVPGFSGVDRALFSARAMTTRRIGVTLLATDLKIDIVFA